MGPLWRDQWVHSPPSSIGGVGPTGPAIMAPSPAASNTMGATGPVLVADVNGDGIPDICSIETDTLEVFLGEGGGMYATPFYIGTGPSPSTILVENLHGQSASTGLPDIVAPDNSGGVMVLLNLTK